MTRLLSLILISQTWTFASTQISLIPPSTFPGDTTTTLSTSATSAGNTTAAGTPTASASYPSLSGYSSCVTNCLNEGSAFSNCTSVVDVNCFCPSRRFTDQLVNCVSNGCSEELGTAEALAQLFCNLANTSTSLSFPTPPPRFSATSSQRENRTTTSITPVATSSSGCMSLLLSGDFRMWHVAGFILLPLLDISVV